MAEISPWTALQHLEQEGIIKPGQKPTREQMLQMNELLHDASEKHLLEVGERLFAEYFVPIAAVPVELADGTKIADWCEIT